MLEFHQTYFLQYSLLKRLLLKRIGHRTLDRSFCQDKSSQQASAAVEGKSNVDC